MYHYVPALALNSSGLVMNPCGLLASTLQSLGRVPGHCPEIPSTVHKFPNVALGHTALYGVACAADLALWAEQWDLFALLLY
jgi:hypothetical protein